MKRRITCGHCRGTGLVDLPAPLNAVYLFVKSRRRATSSEVWEGVCDGDPAVSSVTSSNARLDKLVSLGMLRRLPRREGRGFVWVPA